jgi:hypothetical protein
MGSSFDGHRTIPVQASGVLRHPWRHIRSALVGRLKRALDRALSAMLTLAACAIELRKISSPAGSTIAIAIFSCSCALGYGGVGLPRAPEPIAVP